MKIIRKISASIIILNLLILQGCNDEFIDKTPLGEVTEDGFFKTGTDAIMATNAVYNVLRNWRIHTGGFPMFDIMSDDATKGSNPYDGFEMTLFETFTFTPSSENISGFYSTLYEAIRKTNIVVERIPAIEMDETLKQRLLGEARFLRAMFYFNLVRGFGDVPLILTTSPPFKVARTAKEEIYSDIIIPDLLFATDNLPERSDYTPEDMGRATRGAAKGLLSKVYLWLNDFANAEKYALEVILSGQYSLEPDYGKVFSVDDEFGTGSVFEVGAIPEGSLELGGNQYANTQGARGEPDRGWGFNRPSWNLINSFEADDPRLDATVIFLGETLDGITVLGDPGTPDTTYTDESKTEIKEIEVYNQKVWTPGSTPRESWGHNMRLLRYADVLLIAAEALNENGNTADALKYLNDVRERARSSNSNILPDITETNKNTLRNIIWSERRVELAMEGHRYFDLVRQERAVEVLEPLGFVQGKHELLPIPQSEIDFSEGTLTQNPGWD